MDIKDVAIAWVDLTYAAKQFVFSKEKIILNRLNGLVEFRTITALMGPSGAGKTTLLKCLNGKLNSGLDLNSRIYVKSNEKIRSCFVAQHSKEHLIMCLTAKQNLIYASKLKNSGLKTDVNHEESVLEIMENFMIDDIAQTIVESCSGGQQKRLTIAIEMTKVIKPNLLCIDEPTTGLDSSAAETVMNCLRNLSKTHRISIITSIHQPNNEIVIMFDSIYVLAKGGNCLFSGPPHEIQTTFEENNIIMNEGQVPIEQLLKYASFEAQEEYFHNIIDKTRKSLKELAIKQTEQQMKLTSNGLQYKSKSFKLLDVWYIIMRTMAQQFVRQWKSLMSQLLFFISFAWITSKLFDPDIGKPSGCFQPKQLSNNSCLKELEDNELLINNQNFVFFTAIISQFIYLCYTTLIYLADVKIFINEHDNHWYSTGSYFIAKTVVEIIPTIIFSTLFGFLSYYSSGQPLETSRILFYMLNMLLSFLCTEGYGHNIGISLVNYPNIAIIISIGLFAVMVMFCNFFILIKDLPLIFQYISNWAYPKFVYNSALTIIYSQNRCSADEKSIIEIKFDVNDNQLADNFYKLVIYLILLRISAFLMLYLKTNFNINFNAFRKQKPINYETNGKDSAIIEMTGNKKRLSIILNEILIDIEKKLIGNDFSINNNLENIGESRKIPTNRQISYLWTNLSLKIPKTLFKDETVILKEINGFFEFGTINALMGSSGAGKTSLLKAINGLYIDYITDETNIRLNKFRKIKTCFIVQDEREHILSGLTAGQAMMFASRLKNPEPNYDHKNNVLKIMTELLISNTFNTSVELCSGGEQKRLVIAMELTSRVKPNLICVDEPTSGLDSNAAEVVIKCLKRLAENHSICVITSIHQPNNEILIMFDKLYVLAKGGQSVFSGRPQDLSQYLIDCGIECTKRQVPIEVLLRHSCNGINDRIVKKMIKKTEDSEKAIIDERSQRETTEYLDGIRRVSKRFYFKDFWILIVRNSVHMFGCAWKLLLAQFVLYIWFGITLQIIYGKNIGVPTGCINFEDDYNNTCGKTEQKLAEETLLLYNIKYNFYVSTLVLFFTVILTTMTFTSDLKIFFNEQRNGWYSTGVFYWSKSIVESIPFFITIIIYSFIIDIYEDSMFFGFLFFITLGAFEIQSLGHFIGIILSSNQRQAVFTSVGFFISMFLFSNFVIPTKDLHYSLQLVSLLSPIKLVMECLLILYYGFDKCSDREFSFVLYFFDLNDSDFYTNTYLLVIQFFIFRTASLIALLLKANPLINSRVEAQNRLIKTMESRRSSKALIIGLTSEYDFEINKT